MAVALRTYRNLFRVTGLAFKGDERVLNAARDQIRNRFRENATLEPSSPEVSSAIEHAQDVAKIIRHNIVQGKKEGELYKLRIHEDTERGDNDTVKLPGGQKVKIDGKKCCDT
ncbi:uncharacterized protein GGS25DRAFT_524971 [Hypoxylon fragiforme]|uniref:uncharacterized protein n=1 Tax=Hypoxylon fragiforme TaxID=63214 RepID=UPI0020C6CC27|nr:uncharacterized protein GGS25DRAFT_524971 [Hypoxylon fragiforme]KAI2605455.1 hypothetical protein GGS25DRAFT_524971 [Hypoxylon fragiforme]